MITLLTVLGIFLSLVIIVIMSVAIIQFGTLISRTEDKQERIGKRTGPTDAPQRHARYFVTSFLTIYLVGVAITVTQEYIRWVIIGSVMITSAILFSGMALWWSMSSYTEMKKNERDLKGSWVA